MKKKLLSLTVIGILIGVLFSFFMFSEVINKAVLLGCDIFIHNVFPSLFPMFLISNILVSIGLPEFLGKIFSRLMNWLFHVKGEGSFIFFMSMISGFPSSAKYIDDLLEKSLINVEEASQLLNFTFFSNPLFLINTVGLLFFKDKTIGILLLIVQFISNIILGIILRKPKKLVVRNNKNAFKELVNHINNDSFFNLFFKSIKSSLSTLFNIFGVIIAFLILTYASCSLLQINNDFAITIISGILEFTSGLRLLSTLEVSTLIKLVIATFFICFGSFSVHAQIMSILKEKKVPYLPFLKARILHSLVGIIIMLFCYFIFF